VTLLPAIGTAGATSMLDDQLLVAAGRGDSALSEFRNSGDTIPMNSNEFRGHHTNFRLTQFL